jgi:hypothetical protein
VKGDVQCLLCLDTGMRYWPDFDDPYDVYKGPCDCDAGQVKEAQ